MARRLPSGRVTFAFTDVVNSTRTFTEHGEAYVDAVRALHALKQDLTLGYVLDHMQSALSRADA